MYYYVSMVITYSKSMDQPGKVANLARGKLNKENEYFPVPVIICRGSAGTGPVILKVDRATGAAFSGFTHDHFFAPLFSHTDCVRMVRTFSYVWINRI